MPRFLHLIQKYGIQNYKKYERNIKGICRSAKYFSEIVVLKYATVQLIVNKTDISTSDAKITLRTSSHAQLS